MTNFTGYLLGIRDTIVKKRGGEVSYGILSAIGIILFALTFRSVDFNASSIVTLFPFLVSLAFLSYGVSGFVPAKNKNTILLLRSGVVIIAIAAIGFVVLFILFALGNTP
jgi:hypothetical protein